MEGQGYRTGAPNSPESPILVTGGVVCRQSTGWGGHMGLSKLSTVTQNQGTAVPVRERTDPEVGLRNPQIPNPESGSESLGRCGGRILAVGESYIVKPQAGGVIWD